MSRLLKSLSRLSPLAASLLLTGCVSLGNPDVLPAMCRPRWRNTRRWCGPLYWQPIYGEPLRGSAPVDHDIIEVVTLRPGAPALDLGEIN